MASAQIVVILPTGEHRQLPCAEENQLGLSKKRFNAGKALYAAVHVAMVPIISQPAPTQQSRFH